MTAPNGQRPPADAIDCDDLLAQQLGAGHPGNPADSLSMMLAECRDDIRHDEHLDISWPITQRHQRPSRGRALTAALAAAAITITGGVIVMARDAQPSSPLWPITELVYTKQTHLTRARQAIEQARQAITQGRYADAQADLDRATAILSGLSAGTQVLQMTAEIDILRQEINSRIATTTVPAQPVDPTVIPSRTPLPTIPSPTAGGTSTLPAGGIPAHQPPSPPQPQPRQPPGEQRQPSTPTPPVTARPPR